MYHEHFGLRQAPFKITPDTRLFFTGSSRGEVLEALVYAIESGEGIVKVVGEVGSGKTMLCRMLEVRLPETVEIVYLANPSLAPDEILQAIALEMALPVGAAATRLQLMHALQQRLVEKHAAGRRVVVFVEEAQGMPLATLEEIRLLSNLETQQDKLLQIVLFGQPELERNLDEPSIRQLRERITHSFVLAPLRADEVRAYLGFRLRAVGYRGPELFTRSALRRLARVSQGLIRRVNILADKALLAAYAAGADQVMERHVRAAIADTQFGFLRRRRPWAWAAAAGLAGAVAVGIAAVRPGLPELALAVTGADHGPAGAGPAPPEPPPARPPVSQTPAPVAEPEPARTTAPVVAAAPAEPPAPPPAPVAASAVSAAAQAESAPPPAAASEPVAEPAPSRPEAPSEPAAPEATAAVVATVSEVTPPAPPVPAPAAARDETPAALPVPADAASLLLRRLAVTNAWLDTAEREHFSIQLLTTGLAQERNLEEFLDGWARQGGLEHIYVYRTNIRGRVWYGVLYREYASYDEARRALAELPPAMRRHGPFIRNIRDVVASSVAHGAAG